MATCERCRQAGGRPVAAVSGWGVPFPARFHRRLAAGGVAAGGLGAAWVGDRACGAALPGLGLGPGPGPEPGRAAGLLPRAGGRAELWVPVIPPETGPLPLCWSPVRGSPVAVALIAAATKSFPSPTLSPPPRCGGSVCG